MSDQIKVQVRHLTKKFGDLLVLSDVSFDVMDGDLLCVVGPTGCGKTTFLNSLVNIYDPVGWTEGGYEKAEYSVYLSGKFNHALADCRRKCGLWTAV